MNHNPSVKFNIINIVENKEDAEDVIETVQLYGRFNKADNVHVEVVTMEEFSQIVNDKLKIDVKFTIKWSYKMCDFKPTLAYLFPDLVKDNSTYDFWGFADMDIVWGSFKNHASLFMGQDKIVISGWWHSTGAAVFSVNEQWTRELFFQSEKYVSLLAENIYHNLDEGGTQIDQANVVEGGKYSIDQTQRQVLKDKFNAHYHSGKNPFDHMFVDDVDVRTWAGLVVWHMGSLKIIRGSKYFPPGRQVLFFHSRGSTTTWSRPTQVEFAGKEYFEDMVTYGYYLPSYTPLHSRFMCQSHESGGFQKWSHDFHEYKPYDSMCFAKLDKELYRISQNDAR